MQLEGAGASRVREIERFHLGNKERVPLKINMKAEKIGPKLKHLPCI